MKSALVLKSSILGKKSTSTSLIDHWVNENSNTFSIIERDLALNPLPVLDINVMAALSGNDLTAEQQELLALSDRLIDEVNYSATE